MQKEHVPPVPWSRKVERHLASGNKTQVLKILDKVIEHDLPLFRYDPAIQENRHLAWLYRIDLLREWGRLPDALAWACLECELNPNNVTAQALKETLKKKLHLGSKKPGALSVKGSSRRLTEDLWGGVAGMREIKAILERDVILPLQEPELYKRYRVDLPNGILFYGPPGCGKTFIARKLAELLRFNFMEVKPSDLASIYVHGGQEKIGTLFTEARKKAPTLIFFDELDALVPNRGGDLHHHYGAEVNEFLAQLNKAWKSKILVIGATNLLQKIDSAIRRPGRMDKKVFIGPPDLEARVELLRLFMRDRPQESIDWVWLAEACECYTPAEIEYIVNEAARSALAERRPIVEEDILKTLENNHPILTAEEVEKFRKEA